MMEILAITVGVEFLFILVLAWNFTKERARSLRLKQTLNVLYGRLGSVVQGPKVVRTRTPEQLSNYRKRLLQIYKEQGDVRPEDDVEFTCDGCECAPECEYVYDLYNTNGDCIAMK